MQQMNESSQPLTSLQSDQLQNYKLQDMPFEMPGQLLECKQVKRQNQQLAFPSSETETSPQYKLFGDQKQQPLFPVLSDQQLKNERGRADAAYGINDPFFYFHN